MSMRMSSDVAERRVDGRCSIEDERFATGGR